ISFLRKTVPGCENARLRVSSSVLGVRETRRIIGKFMLNHEDMPVGCVRAVWPWRTSPPAAL
ncbi:MAG: FAD-dependent oxidoreductase, partial [Akkermansia sp.]|nr:FAD-dependent oxidoreductase [Akkermansia sp.]